MYHQLMRSPHMIRPPSLLQPDSLTILQTKSLGYGVGAQAAHAVGLDSSISATLEGVQLDPCSITSCPQAPAGSHRCQAPVAGCHATVCSNQAGLDSAAAAVPMAQQCTLQLDRPDHHSSHLGT